MTSTLEPHSNGTELSDRVNVLLERFLTPVGAAIDRVSAHLNSYLTYARGHAPKLHEPSPIHLPEYQDVLRSPPGKAIDAIVYNASGVASIEKVAQAQKLEVLSGIIVCPDAPPVLTVVDGNLAAPRDRMTERGTLTLITFAKTDALDTAAQRARYGAK